MTCSRPRYFYFDVGNVLLKFSRTRMVRQLAELTGSSFERVWEVVFEGDLLDAHEHGQCNSREFYEAFCQRVESRPSFEEFCYAASDIFELNVPVVPIVVHLRRSHCPVAVLSNTNETHWSYIFDGRYCVLKRYFDDYVLSHEVGFAKPEKDIFEVACRRADVAPEEIFFVDDREDNVAAARDVGIDAIVFTTAWELADQLRRRNVRWDY